MFLLGCLLSGLANAGTGEDPFMQSITSPECHIYKRGGSRRPGLLNVKFLEAFSVTSRHWVATSRRQFYPSMERRDVRFERHDVDFECLWNVATLTSNVATLNFTPSGTSRLENLMSRR